MIKTMHVTNRARTQKLVIIKNDMSCVYFVAVGIKLFNYLLLLKNYYVTIIIKLLFNSHT